MLGDRGAQVKLAKGYCAAVPDHSSRTLHLSIASPTIYRLRHRARRLIIFAAVQFNRGVK